MAAYGTDIARAGSFAAAERDWYDRRRPGSEGNLLFRVEAVSYSYTIDADREEYGSTAPRLELFGYEVERWTPYGATLRYVWGGCRKKWVDLRPGAKQWASRTAQEAVEQLRERRRRQVWVLRRQLQRAKYEEDLAARALVGELMEKAPCV